MSMILIDGSIGEGGGQILRTALSLSLVTGQPFRIEKIRAGRKKPGLLHQHLTAVNAAAQVSRGEVKGNQLGSTSLIFVPGKVIPGRYDFAVGTAGSATLVLQTILPGLMLAKERSVIFLQGGTHNLDAPPFDFLQKAFLPVLERMGPRIDIELKRYGFYPGGGGELNVKIQPVEQLDTLNILERGDIIQTRVKSYIANLPRHIAQRELNVVQRKLALDEEDLEIVDVDTVSGQGNILIIEVECEKITEVFTSFGELGKPAETVAAQAVTMTKQFLKYNVPVGCFLADQLLLPFALAKGGSFKTGPLSHHTKTNINIIQKFLGVKISVEAGQKKQYQVLFH